MVDKENRTLKDILVKSLNIPPKDREGFINREAKKAGLSPISESPTSKRLSQTDTPPKKHHRRPTITEEKIPTNQQSPESKELPLPPKSEEEREHPFSQKDKTYKHEPRHTVTARREDQRRRVEARKIGSAKEERAARQARYEAEKRGTTVGDVLKGASAGASAIKAKAKEIKEFMGKEIPEEEYAEYQRKVAGKIKKFAKQTGRDLKDLPREAIEELKNIDLTAAKKSAIASGKSIGKGIQNFGESEAKNLADSKNIDEEYITSGGLRSTVRGEKVRVDPDTREIEVKNSAGMWIPTGRFAEVKIPGTIRSDGIEYTPSARSRVETYELLDNEPDAVSLPRNREELFTYKQEENPFAGNPLGQLTAEEVAARITRQQRGGVSMHHAFDSGIYTSRPKYQQKPRGNVWDSGTYTSQKKTYTEPSTPAYITPQTARLLRQKQSTEPHIEPQRGFAPVGRNTLVDQQNRQMAQAIAADKVRQQAQQQPQSDSFGQSAVSFLFGGRKSSAYGGSRAFTQPSSGSDSLFGGNRSLLGSTITPRTVQQTQQQPQISSEGLFSGNLRNISATTSLFGESRQRASESVLGVVGSGSFASVFPVHYGNKKTEQQQVILRPIKPTGEPKMTAPSGTIEFFRSVKGGMLRIAITGEEYQALASRSPSAGVGFFRVQGSRKPVLKVYPTQAEIAGLQAQGRATATPVGARKARR